MLFFFFAWDLFSTAIITLECHVWYSSVTLSGNAPVFSMSSRRNGKWHCRDKGSTGVVLECWVFKVLLGCISGCCPQGTDADLAGMNFCVWASLRHGANEPALMLRRPLLCHFPRGLFKETLGLGGWEPPACCLFDTLGSMWCSRALWGLPLSHWHPGAVNLTDPMRVPLGQKALLSISAQGGLSKWPQRCWATLVSPSQ